MSATQETRPGAQAGETVCPGCAHGPACRVIPCLGCGKSWHLLGLIDNPFICPRCEDAA